MSLHNIWKESVPRTGKRRADVMSLQPRETWCGGKDSNLHGIATASPSSWCVCQFRHHRKNYEPLKTALFGPPLEERPAVLLLIVLQTAAKSIKTLADHSIRSERFGGRRLRLLGCSWRCRCRCPWRSRRCRSCRWTWRSGRGGFLSGLIRIVNHRIRRSNRPIRAQRQRHRANHEHHRAPGRRLRKHRRGAARPECGLATGSAKSPGQVGRFAALQQHHDDQNQAIQHEKRAQQPSGPPKPNHDDPKPNGNRNHPFHPTWHRFSTSNFFKFPASAALLTIHDRRKRLCFKARSANQRAIQLRLPHQPRDIVRLDAAAVENSNAGSRYLGKLIVHTAAQEPVSRRGNLRRSRTACPNRPDWLVS